MLGWEIDPQKLRKLREEAQLTARTLATLVGCHYTTIHRVERGDQQVSAGLIWDILNALSTELGREITVPHVARPCEYTPRRRRKTTPVDAEDSAA